MRATSEKPDLVEATSRVAGSCPDDQNRRGDLSDGALADGALGEKSAPARAYTIMAGGLAPNGTEPNNHPVELADPVAQVDAWWASRKRSGDPVAQHEEERAESRPAEARPFAQEISTLEEVLERLDSLASRDIVVERALDDVDAVRCSLFAMGERGESGHGIRLTCGCEQCVAGRRDAADANRWRELQGRESPGIAVHPSNLPTIVDLLEDEVAALRKVAEAARDVLTIALNDAGPEAFATMSRLREALAAFDRRSTKEGK